MVLDTTLEKKPPKTHQNRDKTWMEGKKYTSQGQKSQPDLQGETTPVANRPKKMGDERITSEKSWNKATPRYVRCLRNSSRFREKIPVLADLLHIVSCLPHCWHSSSRFTPIEMSGDRPGLKWRRLCDGLECPAFEIYTRAVRGKFRALFSFGVQGVLLH